MLEHLRTFANGVQVALAYQDLLREISLHRTDYRPGDIVAINTDEEQRFTGVQLVCSYKRHSGTWWRIQTQNGEAYDVTESSITSSLENRNPFSHRVAYRIPATSIAA